MAFVQIRQVPRAQEIIDAALAAGRRVKARRKKGDDPLAGARKKERERITAITTEMRGRLQSIVRSFPSMDELNPFYYELCRNSFDVDALREKLGRIDNTKRTISSITRTQRGRVEAAEDYGAIKRAIGALIGRLAGAIERLDEDLRFLEQVRRTLEGFPVIKERFTVCIAGFPNVGKTTLFCTLTGAGAEINTYAFTTKRLNVKSSSIEAQQIQFIDTPGTLNRDKMNTIEQQADLALTHMADVIVYVYDPTPTYTQEKQDALREVMDSYGAPVIEYVSKADIATKEQLAIHEGRIFSADELLETIKKLPKEI